MADFDDSNARYEGTLIVRKSYWSVANIWLSDDRARDYDRRERSASPRGERDDRARSRSPGARDRP